MRQTYKIATIFTWWSAWGKRGLKHLDRKECFKEKRGKKKERVHWAIDRWVLDHIASLTSKHPARATVTQTYNESFTYSHSRRQYVVEKRIEEATAPPSQSFNKPYRQPQQRADSHMASWRGLLWYYYCVCVPEGWDVMDVSSVGNKLRRSIHSGEEVHSQGRPPDRQYGLQIFPSAHISIHSWGLRLSDWGSLSCSLKRALVQGSVRGSQ